MSTDFKESINPAYSNLALAIDCEEMNSRISSKLPPFWGNDVSLISLDVPRVFPRPGGNLLIQYQIKVKNLFGCAEKTIFLFGYLTENSRSSSDLKNIDDSNSMKFEDLGLTIPVFPSDPRLSQLPGFIERGFILDCFNLIPDSDVGHNRLVNWDVLSYRIESRCVIRYSLHDSAARIGNHPENTIIAKIYRPKRLASALRVIKTLESEVFSRNTGNKFSIPQVLFEDEKQGIMILAEAPGKSLHFLITKPIFEKGCAAAGELLRLLHSANPEKMRKYKASDELADLEDKSLLACRVFPGIRDQSQKIINKLKDVKGNYLNSAPRIFTHRDFYDKQIMYSEKRTTLLDCDNAVSADPALDYGNFLAHLILRKLQFPDYSKNIQRGEDAFVNSYNNFSDDFKLRAEWWKAVTLSRLIILYSFRPKWRKLIDELVVQTNRVLGGR